MKVLTPSLLLTAAAGLLCAAPSLRADNLALTSPGDGVSAAGVYVGPYQGTVNGTSMPIICDDFTHDTFLGETWQATPTNLGTGNLGNTLYGASAQSQYDVAAYLATELLAPGLSATTQADLQYAIWYLFDPSQVTTYLDSFGSTYAGLLSAAAADVSAAQTAESKASTALTAAQLAEFTIYTPVASTAMCGSGPCPTSPPQEFLVYTDPPLAAPEPSTLALLGAGMCLLAVLVRRRNKAAGVVSVA